MKALEKDRNRRYETANGLAADVQRYLNDEPVEARPSTRMYRFRKFIRRNKAGVLAATRYLLRLRRHDRRHRISALREQRLPKPVLDPPQQAARSDQVAHFLQDMLKGVAPSVALGRDDYHRREIRRPDGKSR